MKLAAVADVHIGNHRRFGGGVSASINKRCRAVLDGFSAAVTKAIEAECDTFLVAGDLLDYVRPEAPIYAELQRTLRRGKDEGLTFVLMVGNHDQNSTAPGDHALAPLQDYAVIIEKPTMHFRGAGSDVVCIPFQPGHAREWLRGAVESTLGVSEAGRGAAAGGRPLLLAIHLGIKDAKTAPWLAASPDSIDVDVLKDICFDNGITHVIAGNWHDRRQWTFTKGEQSLHVLQLGALVPTGWDNPGLYGYGTVGFWSKGKLKMQEVPGPRFIKVHSDDELQQYIDENEDAQCDLFVSQLCDPNELRETMARLSELSKACKISEAFEALPDQAVAKAEARSAAEKARSSKTLAEALDGYVKRVPMADHVNRTNVLTRCRGYLKP